MPRNLLPHCAVARLPFEHNMGLRWGCAKCDVSWDRVPEVLPCELREQHSTFTAPDYLDRAAALFRERNAVYGSNYQRQGAALLALFPEGGIPAITTVEDANRLHVFVACVTKMMRYAYNWESGGHQDSARDLQVYAAMLEEFTDEACKETKSE